VVRLFAGPTPPALRATSPRGGEEPGGPAVRRTYLPLTSRVIRKTFRLTITATTPVAIIVVTR
jgi:hypothetical protein